MYVLVSSFDPLRVYVFEEGLVRFATEKYSTNLKGLRKRFVHLTNYSVNKKAEGYTALNDKKGEEFCAKWDFRTLRKKFQELGLDFEQVFKGVHDVIIKGLISIEPHIVNNLNRCVLSTHHIGSLNTRTSALRFMALTCCSTRT